MSTAWARQSQRAFVKRALFERIQTSAHMINLVIRYRRRVFCGLNVFLGQLFPPVTP
jgi:hypothetical protein